jgi:RNA polymerase sigma-70 factor (ECF subfamily)
MAAADERPDAELIAAMRAGQAEAFAVLAERHRGSLLRCIALLIGDASEAESLTQEALAGALEHFDRFRPELSFPAWLRGIALNLARNHLRARARHARAVLPEELAGAVADSGRGVLSQLVRDELCQRLWLAVGLLPEPYREAFVMHYVDGLDYASLSAVTGVSAGALRVRAVRARSLLRDQLGNVVDTWVRGP